MDKGVGIGEVIALHKALGGGGSSGGGVLVVGVTESGDYLVCDKTCKEMWDGMKDGGVVIDGTTWLYSVCNAINDDGYSFVSYEGPTFTGNSDNDYPTVKNK